MLPEVRARGQRVWQAAHLQQPSQLAYIKSNGVAGGGAQGAGGFAHEVVLSLVDLADEGEGSEGGAE